LVGIGPSGWKRRSSLLAGRKAKDRPELNFKRSVGCGREDKVDQSKKSRGDRRDGRIKDVGPHEVKRMYWGYEEGVKGEQPIHHARKRTQKGGEKGG